MLDGGHMTLHTTIALWLKFHVCGFRDADFGDEASHSGTRQKQWSVSCYNQPVEFEFTRLIERRNGCHEPNSVRPGTRDRNLPAHVDA